MQLHTGVVRTHVRESALKVDSARNNYVPCRTGESNLRQRRAGPMRYQLSYNPFLTADVQPETVNVPDEVLRGGGDLKPTRWERKGAHTD